MKRDNNLTIVSTCNCGSTQKIRPDPFAQDTIDLKVDFFSNLFFHFYFKEINCDFFKSKCCATFENIEISAFSQTPKDVFVTAFDTLHIDPPSIDEYQSLSSNNNSESSIDENTIESINKRERLSGDEEVNESVCWSSDSEDDSIPEIESENDVDEEAEEDEEDADGRISRPSTSNKSLTKEHHQKATKAIDDSTADNNNIVSTKDFVPYCVDGVVHLSQANFSSWSLLCVGSYSDYNRITGIQNNPNFKNGTEHLLPWTIFLTPDSKVTKARRSYRDKIKVGFWLWI